MRYLIATAALALAAPAIADHHGGGTHAHHAAGDPAAFAAKHAEAFSGAINHPTRAEDKARDQYRHPVETLSFFQVAPDMKVGEYAPGGGWYTRLLGHYLGGEGKLVGIFNDPTVGGYNAETQQETRDDVARFPSDAAGFTGLPASQFSAFTLDSIPADQVGTFDRILVIRSMHGNMRRNVADSELKAMRRLLKADGLLGIVQHRAPESAASDYANGSRGYLRQKDVIGFVEALGFELVGTSEVNANPADTADYPGGVWELPPVLSTKREDLKGRGESDRMTLLFRKRP